MSVLSAAKAYRQLGFSVIPVLDTKKPKVDWKEYQDRIATEEELEAWFAKKNGTGVGIVTGEVSGICVIAGS